MELSLRRVIPTQLIGRFWRGAYFSSFAPLQVQNIPRQPLPSPNWVRVRNRLAGICGSDLHLIYTDGDFRIAPAALPNHEYSYPGHEVVGEVIEVGDKVQELRVGDRVALQSGPNCLSTGVEPVCRSCAAGPGRVIVSWLLVLAPSDCSFCKSSMPLFPRPRPAWPPVTPSR